ncbi:hypothetical protein LUZ60_013560 [Juncus effusus]|nr:hypothetical protein LUZ60_013560 [Juncus effusus]
MGKRTASVAVTSLFSDDNPFRRKPSPPPPETTDAKPSAQTFSELPLKKQKSDENDKEDHSVSPKKRKRKRGETEGTHEKKTDAESEIANAMANVVVGLKRKADDLKSDGVAEFKEDIESFDDENKLLRTVFVGNLPLKVKKKAILKEFGQFGEVESVRIRSVPLVDSKVPRKGAVIQGKVNEAVDSVNAYVVFKEEQSVTSALSQNMALFEGNHIRIDMACPPRKKLKGEGPLYDRKRTLFVGNLPFDVKDEELYSLFCGVSNSVEAVRVIRDSETSIGKGIAYVLFKTREAANSIMRRRDLKIRDRVLRVTHAKISESAPKKTPKSTDSKPNFSQNNNNKFKAPISKSDKKDNNDKPKSSANLSYQGVRASKSGVPKKTGTSGIKSKRESFGTGERIGKRKNLGSEKEESFNSAGKKKRPAVAARKAKQLLKKRKNESSTPGSLRKSKKMKK